MMKTRTFGIVWTHWKSGAFGWYFHIEDFMIGSRAHITKPINPNAGELTKRKEIGQKNLRLYHNSMHRQEANRSLDQTLLKQ